MEEGGGNGRERGERMVARWRGGEVAGFFFLRKEGGGDGRGVEWEVEMDDEGSRDAIDIPSTPHPLRPIQPPPPDHLPPSPSPSPPTALERLLFSYKNTYYLLNHHQPPLAYKHRDYTWEN